MDTIDSHFVDVVEYKPLNGSSYIELPSELRNSSKGLINIKNNDNESFRWCHVRLLSPKSIHPERVIRSDRELSKSLNYTGVEFPVSQKHYKKIETQNGINVNVFGYEKEQLFPIYISKENNNNVLNLLLIVSLK